jgi:hypothetical protein
MFLDKFLRIQRLIECFFRMQVKNRLVSRSASHARIVGFARGVVRVFGKCQKGVRLRGAGANLAGFQAATTRPLAIRRSTSVSSSPCERARVPVISAHPPPAYGRHAKLHQCANRAAPLVNGLADCWNSSAWRRLARLKRAPIIRSWRSRAWSIGVALAPSRTASNVA